MHTCDLCLKEFATKQHLTRHCSRSNVCNLKTDYNCKWCNKSFLYPSNKLRHERVACIIKRNQAIKEQEKIRLLELKLVELETIIKAGINPINLTTGNNTCEINSIIAGNHNHITINKYGSEDISYITHKQFVAIFKKCHGSIPAFIMLKHFNNSAPENRNVYIADLKSKYALTYDGNRWNITDRNVLLDEMYSENKDYLKEKYEEKIELLDDITASTFRRFLDSEDGSVAEKIVKENIRQMLFNERESNQPELIP
jgi:hypothetical protein